MLGIFTFITIVFSGFPTSTPHKWENTWGVNKAEVDLLLEKFANGRLITYHVSCTDKCKDSANVQLGLVMAAIANRIHLTTCVEFRRAEGDEINRADIVVDDLGDNNCGVQYGGMPKSRHQAKCDEVKTWLLDRVLIYHLNLDEAFRYPLYSEKGEVRLWFMEVSDLNSKFKCPCADVYLDCGASAYTDVCDVDGIHVGKCLKYCGVCPYYDYHI